MKPKQKKKAKKKEEAEQPIDTSQPATYTESQ
jgi:hypothetical protein